MQWQAAQMAATWTAVAFLQVVIFIVVRTVIECPKKCTVYLCTEGIANERHIILLVYDVMFNVN
jgi:hypothetical protein